MAERKRSYKLGHRAPGLEGTSRGIYAKGRFAFTQIMLGQFVIWKEFAEDADGNQTDQVLDIKFFHNAPNRRPHMLNLSACTVEELTVLREIFNEAVDMAMPMCIQRDKEAKDAFENGDDSHSRIYRAVPKLVHLKGPKPKHGKSVHDGPEDASRVPSADGDSDAPVRGEGAEVAQRNSDDISSEDNGSETD